MTVFIGFLGALDPSTETEQVGRLGGAQQLVQGVGRLDVDVTTDTTPKECAGLAVPMRRLAQYRFLYELIYQTQQGALGLVGGMQCAMVFDGQLIELGYSILQNVQDGQPPKCDATLTAGAWLGSSSLGPGSAYKTFQIGGTIRTGDVGGYLRLKVRGVGIGLLTNPSVLVSASSSVVFNEC